MTVIYFLRGGFPNVAHRYREIQIHTCQRMITINRDIVVLDFYDGDHHRARVRINSELHSDCQIVNLFKLIARDRLK